ncbi:hypothetical protein BX616_004363 [Lobosporangium transversale]|uniref:Uncharacterized protein n=1 Tax=Lobosporangium transversale TaxID=64571 RepID=A0A1Y2GG28_9FUNG|nr:hypothetical protein BCR41DRAFT_358443 [Lobosporangium transversale]KAF9916194.1 hypothetical protein BX616_004363 [Lobosporangium transversale]ORZ09767.1 hypothetical protein BCR41DRAFT_358443 [Lobosporangium transversale]|eukprot:XP_021879037.1 hypothetical protein BCR41DRAFT_358443 [Lobosporangium transversale]
MPTKKEKGKGKKEDVETVDKSSFWTKPGMQQLVAWLTDPDNHRRMNNARPTSGNKPNDLRREIAAYVKKETGVDWTSEQIKSKIQYAKQRYNQAKEAKELMMSTEEGNTENTYALKKVKDICPYFDDFDAVYAGSLARNPPPLIEVEDLTDPAFFDSDSDDASGTSSVANGNSEVEITNEVPSSKLTQKRTAQGMEAESPKSSKGGPSKKRKPKNDDIGERILEAIVQTRRELNDSDLWKKDREASLIYREENLARQEIRFDNAKALWEVRKIEEEKRFQDRCAQWEAKKTEEEKRFQDRCAQWEDKKAQWEIKKEQWEGTRVQIMCENATLKEKLLQSK